MASYKLEIKASAAKELEDLPKQYSRRIVSRITSLGEDPRPSGCQKLSDKEQYRVRRGPYRILYQVDDATQTVTVIKIGHRREIYH